MAELTWIESRNTYEKYLFAQILPHLIIKYADSTSKEMVIQIAKYYASRGTDQFFKSSESEAINEN